MIITLTTDFGTKDYYLGVLKGKLLSLDPQPVLVDITHELEGYDIAKAAIIVKNIWRHFPEGTAHLVAVHNSFSAHPAYLIVKHRNHFFIGPDNGIFSLIFDDMPAERRRLTLDAEHDFPLYALYADAIHKLNTGVPLTEIGTETERYLDKISLRPVASHDQIRGTVIYVDKYENVMININRDLFERVGAGRPFEIYFKRYDPIVTIAGHFTDVPVGDTLCRFNSAGYLEIAVNMGKAASLLGLDKDDTIQVDFL